MKTDSGSMRIWRPDWYDPPVIHVHAVEMICLSPPCRASSPMNAATAPANATKHDAVAR